MEQFLIYLWSISEGVRFILFMIGLAAIVIISFVMICFIMDEYVKWDEIKSYVFKGTTIALTSFILCVAIPSKQDLALIFLYPSIKQGTLNVVQSDTTKKMVEVLNGYLDKQLKELNQ